MIASRLLLAFKEGEEQSLAVNVTEWCRSVEFLTSCGPLPNRFMWWRDAWKPETISTLSLSRHCSISRRSELARTWFEARPVRLTITNFSVNLLENKELLCYINAILICQSFGVVINEQDPCLLLECPVCDMPFTTYLPGRGFRKNQCPCLGPYSDGLRGAGRLVFPLHGSRVSCSNRPVLSNVRPPASALSGATLCVPSTCQAHG